MFELPGLRVFGHRFGASLPLPSSLLTAGDGQHNGVMPVNNSHYFEWVRRTPG